MVRRIDAHQHYWMLARGDYSWLTPELGSIYRDFLPGDLKPHLEHCGVQHTVVIQAAPTSAETEFLLELADREHSIAGVVGWLDLNSLDFVTRLTRFLTHPKFVGIRPMLQDLPEDDWILQPRVLENVSVLIENELPLDLLVFPRHLPHIIKLLNLFPNFRAVIDHLAKPDIKHCVREPWEDYMTEIGRHENVMCKLSGMVTEADWANWKPSDLEPYVVHALSAFGPDRVMFGSDYPVFVGSQLRDGL